MEHLYSTFLVCLSLPLCLLALCLSLPLCLFVSPSLASLSEIRTNSYLLLENWEKSPVVESHKHVEPNTLLCTVDSRLCLPFSFHCY